jgi:hypothetical protein
MKIKLHEHNGVQYWWFECPGCRRQHMVASETSGGMKGWDFNDDLEAPTFAPSILSNGDRNHPTQPRCHSYVRDGKIEFLSDCDHELAGQTVDLPDIKEDTP